MATVSFDFTDAPPAQGGGGSDKIPPGNYRVKVATFKDGTSGNGNHMITANYEVVEGSMQGKRLMDNFVLLADPEKNFGLRRIHQCFLALGVNVQPKMRLDLDKLAARQCIVRVVDDTLPAKGDYEERVISKIVEYHPNSAPVVNGTAPAATLQSATQAPQPAPEPVAATVAAPAAVATVEAPAPAPAEEEEFPLTDVDDLFK